MPSIDPEVPEADALEQAQPVVPGAEAEPRAPRLPLEAPEADVLDQAREVPDEDDEWR
ncbi:MAG TPA: hypothetical protein VME46_13830 [Acidimicrobiales bacterium]|nr:hypothetical protein [Acidimicrobiales bacterium]